jgi:hypothetical protein
MFRIVRGRDNSMLLCNVIRLTSEDLLRVFTFSLDCAYPSPACLEHVHDRCMVRAFEVSGRLDDCSRFDQLGHCIFQIKSLLPVTLSDGTLPLSFDGGFNGSG